MRRIDLEILVAGELRRQPEPRAPQTLMPRVLAAVQAWSGRPWYAREWFAWPLVWQLASAAALIVIVTGGVMVHPLVQAGMQDIAPRLMPPVLSTVPQLALALDTTINTIRVLWRAVVQPFLPYAAVLVGLMCLTCAMAAFALNRAVFERAIHT
jgi:hypothetical protein